MYHLSQFNPNKFGLYPVIQAQIRFHSGEQFSSGEGENPQILLLPPVRQRGPPALRTRC